MKIKVVSILISVGLLTTSVAFAAGTTNAASDNANTQVKTALADNGDDSGMGSSGSGDSSTDTQSSTSQSDASDSTHSSQNPDQAQADSSGTDDGSSDTATGDDDY